MTKPKPSLCLNLSWALVAVGLTTGCALPSEQVEHQEQEQIVRGAARVAAPAASEQVWTEVLFDDGTTEQLGVLTREDLTLQIDWRPRSVIGHGPAPVHGSDDNTDDSTDDNTDDDIIADGAAVGARAVASAASTTSPAKCSDTAFTLMGHRWAGGFDWWFRAGTLPTGLNADRTEAALRSAVKNITRSDNACGRADLVDATSSFQGRTTTASQLTSAGGCNSGDGKNVVDFGDLPTGVLGVACVFSDGDGNAVESDVRLNKVDHRWTNDPGNDSCRDRYDVEAVMTHEFGHTFGLGHVSESGHARLTMSTQINGACQASERALGSGDMRGLRQLY